MKKEHVELRYKLRKLRDEYGEADFYDVIKGIAPTDGFPTGKAPLPKKRKKGKPKERTKFLLRRVWVDVKLQQKIYKLERTQIPIQIQIQVQIQN